MKYADSDIQVAGVVGNQVRIYGSADDNGFRYFIRSQDFSNYGQAKLYADEYEQGQRDSRPVGRR